MAVSRREFLEGTATMTAAALFLWGIKRWGIFANGVEAGGSAPNLFEVDDGGLRTASENRWMAEVMFESLREGEVNINLFDGQEIRLELKEEKDRHYTPKFRSWAAHDDEQDAHLVMVDNGAVLNGQLRMGEKIYRFWPQPGGKVLIGEDKWRLTPENETLVSLDDSRKRFSEEAGVRSPVLAEGGEGATEVKIGLVFDKTAQQYYGGSVDVMESQGALSVSWTNSMFEASGIVPRQVLGYSGPVDYDSTGKEPNEVMGELLGDTYTIDWLPVLRQIRDEYALDQAMVIIDHDSLWAGMAAVNGDPNMWFSRQFQFGLMNVRYLGSIGIAHEFGHLAGMCHAHDDYPPGGGCGGLSDSSFGYHGSNFATVMAYPAADGSKPWIEMMSNPGVLYNGESTGAEGYANVAEAQNYSLPIISNYRRDALSKLYLPFVSR